MKILASKIYKCEIITPLIMKNAERQLEIRTQEIIGLLRWWYRFYKAGEVNSLKELKEKEAEVWGSQEKRKKFWVKVNLTNESQIRKAYLCMNDSKRGVSKTYHKIRSWAYYPANYLLIEFKFKPSAIKIEDEIDKIWKFLSIFGGLGARWRRGFSSVMWQEVKLQGNTLQKIAENIVNEFGNINLSNHNDQHLESFLNLRNVSIYLLKPKENFWNTWEEAMNDLRDKFYRKLKGALGISSIGKTKPRLASPLVIQIKKTTDKKFFGIIIVWKNTSNLDTQHFKEFVNFSAKFEEFISNFNQFEMKEINLRRR